MSWHRRARGLVWKAGSELPTDNSFPMSAAAEVKCHTQDANESGQTSSPIEQSQLGTLIRKNRVLQDLPEEKKRPDFQPQDESPKLDTKQLQSQPSIPLLERPRAVFCLVFACLPVFVFLSLIVPPFDDELYYWCWSQELQFSYFDHPPMVAYMIRLSTSLFGHSILAIRVPCIVSALVVIAVVTWLSRPRSLIPYIILSPVPTFAAVMITPDVPMLMFWALYIAWLVFIHKRLWSDGISAIHNKPKIWHWVLGGLIIGCGVLGKYTTGLAVISGFFSFVLAGQWRRWIVGYTIQGLTALLVASPILIYNIENNFASVLFQWDHAMCSPEPGLFPFMEFVGIQMLFFGTFPFLVFVWGVWQWRSLIADPTLRVCSCLFLLPFGFFLYKATQGRLEGNWAFPCYLACWPLVAEFYRRVAHLQRWRVLSRFAFIPALVFSMILLIHAIVPLPFIPVESDRSTRQWDKMGLARTVADDLRKAGYTGPVYAFTYQWVSLLRWYGVDLINTILSLVPVTFPRETILPSTRHVMSSCRRQSLQPPNRSTSRRESSLYFRHIN